MRVEFEPNRMIQTKLLFDTLLVDAILDDVSVTGTIA